MHKWVLSKHYKTSAGEDRTVARAYAVNTLVPELGVGDDDWHLCLVFAAAHQLEAAAQDPRVQVFRSHFSKITPEAAATYARYGAVPGMTLGEMIDTISEHEPLFLADCMLSR